jgi:hypothetical protein
VLIGALAAIRYRALTRTTTDVDFLVGSLAGVKEHFEGRGYDVRVMTEPGADEPYVAFIRGRGVAVDALAAETAYQREAMTRAVDGVLSVEDVIVHKLLAWRPRDRDDIDSILAVGHQLDRDYIARWAAEWQVTERWRTALAAAGEG